MVHASLQRRQASSTQTIASGIIAASPRISATHLTFVLMRDVLLTLHSCSCNTATSQRPPNPTPLQKKSSRQKAKAKAQTDWGTQKTYHRVLQHPVLLSISIFRFPHSTFASEDGAVAVSIWTWAAKKWTVGIVMVILWSAIENWNNERNRIEPIPILLGIVRAHCRARGRCPAVPAHFIPRSTKWRLGRRASYKCAVTRDRIKL